jgi:hypothetical protein
VAWHAVDETGNVARPTWDMEIDLAVPQATFGAGLGNGVMIAGPAADGYITVVNASLTTAPGATPVVIDVQTAPIGTSNWISLWAVSGNQVSFAVGQSTCVLGVDSPYLPSICQWRYNVTQTDDAAGGLTLQVVGKQYIDR